MRELDTETRPITSFNGAITPTIRMIALYTYFGEASRKEILNVICAIMDVPSPPYNIILG